jgi:hypothetical protein
VYAVQAGKDQLEANKFKKTPKITRHRHLTSQLTRLGSPPDNQMPNITREAMYSILSCCCPWVGDETRYSTYLQAQRNILQISDAYHRESSGSPRTPTPLLEQ